MPVKNFAVHRAAKSELTHEQEISQTHKLPSVDEVNNLLWGSKREDKTSHAHVIKKQRPQKN
ncbi:MAG: hypothetical protein ACRD8U_02235 [Pyrinomonadaceae bacterium]